jgi:hypothetical protein
MGLVGMAIGLLIAWFETAADSHKLNGFFEVCERLYQWFWRSPTIRWAMIFLCAWVGVAIIAPVWVWLEGAPRPVILNAEEFRNAQGQPAPMALLWAMTGLIAAIPLLLACVRVSEDIDIKNGIAWPVLGKSWWMAVGRFVRRAILLLPIAFVGAFAGLEAFKWGVFASVKAVPPSKAWFEALFGSWAVIAVLPGFGALGVVCAWWLSVKLMTRGARDARKSSFRTVVGFVHGLFYVAVAIGLATFDIWYYGGKSLTAGGLLGPVIDQDLWWLSQGFFWGFLIMAIVSLFMGLRYWYHTFAASGPGATDGVHGRADLADLARAAEAASGRSGPDSTEGLDLNY